MLPIIGKTKFGMTFCKNKGFLLQEVLLSMFIAALLLPLFSKAIGSTITTCNTYRLSMLKHLDMLQTWYFLTEDCIKSTSITTIDNVIWLFQPSETILYRIKNKRLHRQPLGSSPRYITDTLNCKTIIYAENQITLTTQEEHLIIETVY